ncbi:MAG: transketolase [Planctomycetota bacterium]|jgi:transketolase|nr:transketolase [Planctomycetota bacterium]
MLTKEKIRELEEQARKTRILVLRMLNAIGAGHLGGSLSVVEVLTILYFQRMNLRPAEPRWPDRDRLVLSKGHAGPALYATLAYRGYFPVEECLTLNQPGTLLPSHCDMTRTIGIDMTAGSLGQGLSAAVGMALAGKLDRKDYRVYAVVGDGEAQEGQIWEALMYAAHRKLDNLTVFLDYNKLQIDGPVAEINGLEPLAAKTEAFGLFTQRIDGHDFAALDRALDAAGGTAGRPAMIILDTVKAKGACFAEGQLSSHHRAVSDDDLKAALAALDAKGGAN